jgi:hypothetical protein
MNEDKDRVWSEITHFLHVASISNDVPRLMTSGVANFPGFCVSTSKKRSKHRGSNSFGALTLVLSASVSVRRSTNPIPQARAYGGEVGAPSLNPERRSRKSGVRRGRWRTGARRVGLAIGCGGGVDISLPEPSLIKARGAVVAQDRSKFGVALVAARIGVNEGWAHWRRNWLYA